jgi:hypothetical protein
MARDGFAPIVQDDAAGQPGQRVAPPRIMKDLSPAERWLVLGTFAFTSGIGAFLCMNFSAVSAVSKDVLCTDDTGLNLTYSIVLLTVLPVAFPVVMYIERHFYSLSFLAVVANVAAGWLRWLSVVRGSYTLALLSSVFVGLSAAVVINSFAIMGARYFPPSQRAMAVSLAVQSNYAGWGLGAVVMPNVVSSAHDLERAMLVQAFIISFSAVTFALFFREAPLTPPCDIEALAALPLEPKLDNHASTLSPWESVKRLFAVRKTAMQMFVFSSMSGIGFAVPAIQDEVFTSSEFGQFALSSSQSGDTNVAFIFAGVLVGIVLPLVAKGERQRDAAFKATSWVATFGLTGMAVLVLRLETSDGTLSEGAWTSDSVFSYQLVLMVLSGVGTLGSAGIGLAAIVNTAQPVSHEYSAGSVEWWNQVVGAVRLWLSCVLGAPTIVRSLKCSLSQVLVTNAACFSSQAIPLLAGSLSGSSIFVLCAVLAWVATLMFQFGNQSPVEQQNEVKVLPDKASFMSPDGDGGVVPVDGLMSYFPAPDHFPSDVPEPETQVSG